MVFAFKDLYVIKTRTHARTEISRCRLKSQSVNSLWRHLLVLLGGAGEDSHCWSDFILTQEGGPSELYHQCWCASSSSSPAVLSQMDLSKMGIDWFFWVVVIMWQTAVISYWNITLAHEQSLYHKSIRGFLEVLLWHWRPVRPMSQWIKWHCGSCLNDCVVAPGSSCDKFWLVTVEENEENVSFILCFRLSVLQKVKVIRSILDSNNNLFTCFWRHLFTPLIL